MIDLYLIRHAECEANLVKNIIQGGSDTPLTEKGKAQALALRERLQNERIEFDEIYTSELERAIETARIAIPDRNIIICKELNELYQGDFIGKNREETYRKYRDLLDKDNWNFKPPNGQSQKEVAQQMMGWFTKYIISKQKNMRIAAFTHGNSVKSFLAEIKNGDRKLAWKKPIENTSITRIIYDGTTRVIVENDYSHLSCLNLTHVFS